MNIDTKCRILYDNVKPRYKISKFIQMSYKVGKVIEIFGE